MATAAWKFHIHTHPQNSKKKGQKRREKIGNLTFDVFYETCSNNILGNLF